MSSVFYIVLSLLLEPLVGFLLCLFKSKDFRYLSFVICPVVSIIVLSSQWQNLKTDIFNIGWFNITNVQFDIALIFDKPGLFLCMVIMAILVCVQFAYIKLEGTSRKLQRGTHQPYLNLFAFIMCCTILSGNMFTFFVGVELLGTISSLLVGDNNKHSKSLTMTFVFNKFASLLFLVAISMIAYKTESFDFSIIKAFFRNEENYKFLEIPAAMLLISCICKGAQIPFFGWLINATTANSYVSILLHSATIVGIGIIFVTKCYFVFEPFYSVQKVMILIGIFTALWAGAKSLFYTDIKKIIACSTAASMGVAFLACGLGEYSIAILHFVCHAFSKSCFFLSMIYVMHVTSGQKNILKMGGIDKYIPNIVCVVLISAAMLIGVPGFVSSFSKISLGSSLSALNELNLKICMMLGNILSIVALCRLVFFAIYGKSRMNNVALSKIVDADTNTLIPLSCLVVCSIFGSFIAWKLYIRNILHFGIVGMPHSRILSQYGIESIMEVVQIAVAILISFGMLTKRKNTIWQRVITTEENIYVDKMYGIFLIAMRYVFRIDRFIDFVLNKIGYCVSFRVSGAFQRCYDSLSTLAMQVNWLLIGSILCILYISLLELCE